MTEPTLTKEKLASATGSALIFGLISTLNQAIQSPRSFDFSNPHPDSERAAVERSKKVIAEAKANLPLFEEEVNKRMPPRTK